MTASKIEKKQLEKRLANDIFESVFIGKTDYFVKGKYAGTIYPTPAGFVVCVLRKEQLLGIDTYTREFFTNKLKAQDFMIEEITKS